MSYYLPEIISDNTFSALVRSANQPNVQVLYNGTGIHKYAGPVPMVTFDKAFNRSPNGELESITTTINLEGKTIIEEGKANKPEEDKSAENKEEIPSIEEKPKEKEEEKTKFVVI